MDLTSLRPADRPADVQDDVVAPHRAALAALDDPGTNSLVAVSWLAAHLAAAEECVYGPARRRLPDGAALVHEQVRVDRRLHEALWRLDRRLTGDVHHAHRDVAELERAVRSRLEEHAEREHGLLEQLLAVLDVEERADLGRRLATALAHAPTRPHPHSPHPLWAGGVLHRLEAMADRLRDLMDGRDVPTPHEVRPPLQPGHWGSYVMARPFAAEGTDAADSPVAPEPPEGGSPEAHSRGAARAGTCGP